MQRRKATYKLYPCQRDAIELRLRTALHCELYNAALQERVEAWQKYGHSVTYYDQQNTLPELKRHRTDLVPLGSHALQETLRRLDRAFQAFFRRVKAGQSPGFPRYKSACRFSGFTYPDPAGWKLQRNGDRGATLRIGSGDHQLLIRARGRHRFGEAAKPNDLTVYRKGSHWYASVTFRVPDEACARARTDNRERGVDFGVTDWATFDDGQTIENPRFFRRQMDRLSDLQRDRARKKRGSVRCRRLSRQIARLHEKIANQRLDFVHKQTTQLVASCKTLATEELAPKNMSRSAKGTVAKPGKRVRQKAGLNREILSVGLGMAHAMLSYKAVEAGTTLHVAKTRQLKPSQRCAACWEVTPKTLSDRVHACSHCGHSAPRDKNSAAVVLIDAHTPGTGVTARLEPLASSAKRRSTTRETPATALGA